MARRMARRARRGHILARVRTTPWALPAPPTHIAPRSRLVQFSLLLELQLAHSTPATERQLFHDTVTQAVLAEELGYHGVWAVEHHGLYEYSHSSAPEVLLAFIAARTSRIRIGHAVTLTPHRYNHPIRVAERVAVLDILSNGRVNWG